VVAGGWSEPGKAERASGGGAGGRRARARACGPALAVGTGLSGQRAPAARAARQTPPTPLMHAVLRQSLRSACPRPRSLLYSLVSQSTPRHRALHACQCQTKALFSSPQKAKSFQDSPSQSCGTCMKH